ncbi:MAG: N-acetyl-alpha-D-glucosaminyl L-malate synthase BshA [Flavobacteriaceae bacterium TMED212]|nr:N-acetyl-alpha-D-glucosaminyl L-malate synthase BshA [Paracoccaceae bacterium]OUW76539.1 MAG: N-acetyl-alpha-D-glucosaminyl L-malate synthase BshA [Flavobacteriaceae bacterium TMED212]
MKIVIVCYPTFGGSGVVATELGLYLVKKGHEIHFITYRQPVRIQNLTPNLYFHEVHVPTYDLFKYQPYELALSSKIVEVVNTYNINLLHVHYAIPHAYAAYMGKKMLEDQGLEIPMITTLHGTDITLVGSHPFYKKAVQFSINHSEYVTAVSQSLKDDTERLFEITSDIKVIPNFIDLQKIKFRDVPCEKIQIAAENELIITHISNFRPLKRILDILKIFKIIKDGLNVKLLMVGDGPEKERAIRYCKVNQLEKDVLFVGKSNEIDNILCFSDLFLLPSEKESFGLAALEAMAHGVPVVCSDIGGLPEVIENGISGFLCPVGDINVMAEKVNYLLSDKERLKLFKSQAYQSSKKFDIKKIISKYESVYNHALETYSG